MTNFILSLLNITVTMSVVIALLLLCGRFIKKRFTAFCRFIIWAVVIIRLCLPIGNTAYSLFNIDVPVPSITLEENSFISNLPENTVTPDTPSQPSAPESNEQITNDPVASPDVNIDSGNADKIPVEPTVDAETEETVFELTPDLIGKAVFAVWLIGAAAFVSYYLLRYVITVSKLNAGLTLPTDDMLCAYVEAGKELGVSKLPRLYVNSRVSSPMLYGFFVHKIILPDITLEHNSVKKVLMHELNHYKRGDLYLKLLSLLANAMHWFNPLAYVAVKQLDAEMELSCDESILKNFPDEERVEYGRTMLEIVRSSKDKYRPLTTSFNPKKSAVVERFDNILNSKRKRKGLIIISTTILFCVLITVILSITLIDNWVKIDTLNGTVYTKGRHDPGDICEVKYIHDSYEFIFDAYCPSRQGIEFSRYDITGDDVGDICLNLYTEFGNILYCFEANSKELIKADDASKYITDNTSVRCDEGNYYITVEGTEHSVSKTDFEDFSDASLSVNIHMDGNRTSTFTDNMGINTEYYCYADDDNSLIVGSIKLYYKYKNNELYIDKSVFQRYQDINGRDDINQVIKFETNSENWELYYRDNYYILKDLTGEHGEIKLSYSNTIKANDPAYAYVFENIVIFKHCDVSFPNTDSIYIENIEEDSAYYPYDNSLEKIYTYHDIPLYALIPSCSNNNDYYLKATIEEKGDKIRIKNEFSTNDNKVWAKGYYEIDIKNNSISTYIPEDDHYDIKISDVYNYTVENVDEYDYVYKTVEAFINNDVTELETRTFTTEGAYYMFSTMELGDYKIVPINIENCYVNYLLDVDILHSDVDKIPTGHHQIYFESGINCTRMYVDNFDADIQNISGNSPAYKAFLTWINATGGYYILKVEEVDDFDHYYWVVSDYIRGIYGVDTIDLFVKYAEIVFNIKGEYSNNYYKYLRENNYPLNTGHGGYVGSFDVINEESDGNEYSVTVQHYADFFKAVKSYLVKYTFYEEGGHLIYKDCEILNKDEVKFEPVSFMI